MNKPTYEELEAQVKQLAAENAALKAAFDKPDAWLSWHSIPPTFYEPDRGGEYLKVHEAPGEKNDDGSDSWAVFRAPEIKSPATDAILASLRAEAMADGIEQWADGMADISEYDHIYACDARNYAETLRSKSEVQHD